MSITAFANHASVVSTRIANSYKLPADRQRFFRRKYQVDRLIGALLLVLTSPLTLLLAMLVRLTSAGPGFYKQERVGLDGKTFEMIKLRSMVVDAEKGGNPVWCVKGDLRITPLGRVLRKLHLDELPQLLNVARGEMSLVGPRPERPAICESLAIVIDDYELRLRVKPGITGLAQINLPPDESIEDVQRKQMLDLCYIEQTNISLELRILLATAMRIVGVKGETVMRWMRLCRRNLLVQEGLLQEKLSTRSGIRLRSKRSTNAAVQVPSPEVVDSSGRHLTLTSTPMPQTESCSGTRRPR